ncbi:MAG: hypothetical protein HY348_12555 [Nitrospira defluvii]|nr:hypothetical protein [Nitrospira defluvii]
MKTRLVIAFEAGALAAALLLCAADQFMAREPTLSKVNPQQDLQQLLLFLKEETLVLGESFPQ